MDDITKEKIALFRFSLIAPILNGLFEDQSVKAYLERVCAQKYDVPGVGIREYAPPTVKRWLLDYRKHGIKGITPKVRNDSGKSRILTNDQKDFIKRMKKDNPRFSAKMIYETLLVKGHASIDTLSLATVSRFISKNSLKFRDIQPKERAFEMQYPNICWQSDVSVGPYLNIDGKKKRTYLIMFLDDCSRTILHGEFFYEESLINLQQTLKKLSLKEEYLKSYL